MSIDSSPRLLAAGVSSILSAPQEGIPVRADTVSSELSRFL